LAKVNVKVSPAGSARIASNDAAGGACAAAVLGWDWAEGALKEKAAMHKAKPNFRLAVVRAVNRSRQSTTLS
jgi:hypothetical protein